MRQRRVLADEPLHVAGDRMNHARKLSQLAARRVTRHDAIPRGFSGPDAGSSVGLPGLPAAEERGGAGRARRTAPAWPEPTPSHPTPRVGLSGTSSHRMTSPTRPWPWRRGPSDFGAAVLAFAFTEAALDDLAAAGAFALAADGDLALVVEDFLVEVDFGLGESDSLALSTSFAPALTTASAPSATLSPIERSVPPAAFFTAFVDLLLFFA